MYDINAIIKEHMKIAVKSSNLSRANVLKRMQRLANENGVKLSPGAKDGQLSMAIFDKWLNLNAKEHFPSALALMIFCAAIENNDPFKSTFEPFGFHLVDKDQIKDLEAAKILYAEYKATNSLKESHDDNISDKIVSSNQSLHDTSLTKIIVHRIVPTIKEYGTGNKTYHLQIWKEYYRKWCGYHIHNEKQREYCVDAPDEAAMHVLAKELKALLEARTDARLIINETVEEFVLHSKAKKIFGGHYW